jgi:hypothetical protein
LNSLLYRLLLTLVIVAYFLIPWSGILAHLNSQKICANLRQAADKKLPAQPRSDPPPDHALNRFPALREA